ncbi:MAG TPA: universal stress protein, partial [Ktedonobacterales bacterium]
MCKRVLIPLDGSALAESALASAALLARQCAADLLLVGVTRGRAFPGLLPSAADRQACDIERYLASVAAPLRAESITVETVVLNERPARAIAAQSADRRVDLIVMATH